MWGQVGADGDHSSNMVKCHSYVRNDSLHEKDNIREMNGTRLFELEK